MHQRPDELPEAVGGVDGESDVIAERAGCATPKSRRPVPADLPEPEEGAAPDLEQAEEPEEDPEDVIRPDAGPTG